MSRLGRGETLVVEVDRETERGARIGKTAHALRLRSVLATQCQRKTDDQGTHLFFRDQITQAREVGIEVAARQRAQRPRETEGVVADGESDAAIADVQRKISHAQGDADVVGVSSTVICRRESKNGNRGHQPGQMVIVLSSSPWPATTTAASSNGRPASAVRRSASFGCGYCRVLPRTRQRTPFSSTVGPMITSTPAPVSLMSWSGSACCFSF